MSNFWALKFEIPNLLGITPPLFTQSSPIFHPFFHHFPRAFTDSPGNPCLPKRHGGRLGRHGGRLGRLGKLGVVAAGEATALGGANDAMG